MKTFAILSNQKNIQLGKLIISSKAWENYSDDNLAGLISAFVSEVTGDSASDISVTFDWTSLNGMFINIIGFRYASGYICIYDKETKQITIIMEKKVDELFLERIR